MSSILYLDGFVALKHHVTYQ